MPANTVDSAKLHLNSVAAQAQVGKDDASEALARSDPPLSKANSFNPSTNDPNNNYNTADYQSHYHRMKEQLDRQNREIVEKINAYKNDEDGIQNTDYRAPERSNPIASSSTSSAQDLARKLITNNKIEK